MPNIPGLQVVRSAIHGYGVIAKRDFAPGEVVARVDGVLYREHEIPNDTYALWVDDGWYFDMVDQTRWINHSCDPNGEIEADLDGAGGAWARVVAIRPIRAGDEITYDYAFPAEFAEPCRCGAASCRGFIVDADELHRLALRQRAAR
jgi:SET domain-containing protein